MPNQHIHKIKELISSSGYKDEYNIIPLPVSGSNRQYFRAKQKENPANSFIASYNEDISENIAQFSFTSHFRSKNFNVPEIIAKDESYRYFLLQDLGLNSLFDMIKKDLSEAKKYYRMVVKDLISFQLNGIEGLDLEVAYPVKSLDRRSIMWDLNYFKYYFLKPHNLVYNENSLENDFESFTNRLLEPDKKYFVYRDFQSRNIIIKDEKPWYIDFQGGRMGPLQYDLVSLLNQVKAELSEQLKKELLELYLGYLEDELPGKSGQFMDYYHDFEYFRLMQVMGAYGFRGLVEKKAHFLQSLIPAIIDLRKLLDKHPVLDNYPELRFELEQITEITEYKKLEYNPGLNISINSFSYKRKGIPVDMTGNGGGHIFDCRSLPNPGRLAHLRDYTGLEDPVIEYLDNQNEVSYFIENIFKIIDQSIENYLERGFVNLQINFGCTGGRHRSVYSAMRIEKKIKEKYPEIFVRVKHYELEN